MNVHRNLTTIKSTLNGGRSYRRTPFFWRLSAQGNEEFTIAHSSIVIGIIGAS